MYLYRQRFLVSALPLLIAALTLCSPVIPASVASDIEVEATGSTISSGESHTCAIDIHGGVACWGDNSNGQTEFPWHVGDPGYQKSVELSAGQAHTCSLGDNGNLFCWGYSGDDELFGPTGLGQLVQVSSGLGRACAVDINGSVGCWGLGDQRVGRLPTPVPNGGTSKVTQIATGSSHTCALNTEGLVHCTGYYNGNQLSDQVTTQSGVFQISGNGDVTCALHFGGSVNCWGDYDPGPMWGHFGGGAVQISVSNTHICAVGLDGSVGCWSLKRHCSFDLGCLDNTFGELSPPKDLGKIVEVSAGSNNTCAVDENGIVKCWGDDRYGQSEPPEGLRVLVNRPLTEVGVPHIVGEAKVATTLTADPGPWPSGFNLQCAWFVDGKPALGSNCDFGIGGDTYMKSVSVQITGYKSGYPPITSKISDPLFIDTLGSFDYLQIPPSIISGLPEVGSCLSVSEQFQSGLGLGYQWTRDGAPIEGADKTKYCTTVDDWQHVISVDRIISSDGFVPYVESSAFGVIQAGALNLPTVRITGTPLVGNTLDLDLRRLGRWS